MVTVAYFAGADPLTLTKLAIKGINTLPVSNGWDNHGKDVNHLSKEDNVTCVIGYLHKILPVPGFSFSPQDILYTCRAYSIPVFLVVPEDQIEEAQGIIADAGENVEIVALDDLFDRVMGLIP